MGRIPPPLWPCDIHPRNQPQLIHRGFFFFLSFFSSANAVKQLSRMLDGTDSDTTRLFWTCNVPISYMPSLPLSLNIVISNNSADTPEYIHTD